MKTKRLFKVITAVVLTFVLAAAPATDIPILRDFSITASAAVTSRTSGTTLYVEGSGSMTESTNYTKWTQDGGSPWYNNTSITNIVIYQFG